MDFYLTDSAGKRLHFPLNPERVTAITAAKMQSFEALELGEFRFPRGGTPVVFSWEGIFPGERRKQSLFVKSWRDPKSIAGDLSGWRNSGTKLKLLVTETPINHDVYIETFEHTWEGGYGDARYTLQLVQVREIIIRTTDDAKGNASSSSPSRPVPPTPKTYTVKAGDTLWGIAKKTLGNGAKWPDIYGVTDNKKLIGPDPNRIKAGQVLKLP